MTDVATTRQGARRTPYAPEGLESSLSGESDEAAVRPDGAPAGESVREPTLGAIGWVRWGWRQLTSMRVALLLLMMLAVAALPGSFFPQRPAEPERVVRYLEDNPGTGAWLDRLGFFDVYASPWFSAIYLLLFISLVGCILPRVTAHARALRAEPPRVPRSFARFAVRAEATVPGAPEDLRAAALASLRRRYRARGDVAAGPVTGDTVDGGGGEVLTVRAERGYLRETGNLVFHLALVGVLVAVALGQLLSYRGQVIVIEGRAFANAVVDYDSFRPGTWFTDGSLEPFSLTLDEFTSDFDPSTLQARDFAAYVTVTEGDGAPRQAVIKVNRPLQAGGASVYLSGNGFAPAITVRDGAGEVAFSGPVPFLPRDAVYTSRGVVKVPDVSPGQEQLGFVGFFLPTAVTDGGLPSSIFPQPINPVLVLAPFAGDLGLDDGIPQNVYELDTSGMTAVVGDDGAPVTLMLSPGETAELPDGLGSVTFDALPRFAALDVRHDPTTGWVLAFALLAMTGLGLSLFVPRRRMWLRLTPLDGGRTLISAAALARGDDPGLRTDLDRVLDAVRAAAGERPAPRPTTTQEDS